MDVYFSPVLPNWEYSEYPKPYFLIFAVTICSYYVDEIGKNFKIYHCYDCTYF